MLVADPKLSTGELRRRLERVSGFPALRRIVDDVFRQRADGIKASVALGALEQIATRAALADDRERIRDAVEGLLQRPEAHQLRVLEVAALVSSGHVEMPEDMEAELIRLVTATTPEGMLGVDPSKELTSNDRMCAMALDAAGRWRSFATFGSTPAQSRIAHVVHRAFFLLWQQLKARSDGGAP
jgi:hypothetical protein